MTIDTGNILLIGSILLFISILAGKAGYRFGVPEAGWYREIINTDAVIYGGSGIHNNELLAQPIPCNGYDWSVEVTAPPLATCMLVKKEE